MNNDNNKNKVPITQLNDPNGGSNKFNQKELIYQYNIDTRERFNADLFMRDDNAIIEEVLNVIKLCQRNEQLKIVLSSHRVVEDPIEIHRILWEYEESQMPSKRKKDRYAENQYDHIPLNDTDLKLLIVEYYLEVDEESDMLEVIIAIPRVVHGNSFRILGKLYVPMYQIVDTSTYTKVGSDSIPIRTMFGMARIYRDLKTNMMTVTNENVKSISYTASIFSKKVNAYLFILAKFGLLDATRFMGLEEISISNTYRDSDIGTHYIFNKGDIYIRVPRYIFDNDLATQSFVYAIYTSIDKNTKYEDIFTLDFYLRQLGDSFGYEDADRGRLILESFEGLYDISTMKAIKLPESEKGNIFLLWRWMIREFPSLKVKDGLDIRTKKIRYAEYIAAYYAMYVSKGIHRVDKIKGSNLNNLKRVLRTDPMILIKALSESTLRMYKNSVNDLDSVEPIKFTFKGESGVAGSDKSQVPRSRRAIYPEYIGKIDLDTSSSSDPGLTGVLCPYLELDDGGSFKDAYEPLDWYKEYEELILKYRDMIGRKEVLEFKRKVVGYISEEDELRYLKEGLGIINSLIYPIRKVVTHTEDGLLIPYMIEKG